MGFVTVANETSFRNMLDDIFTDTFMQARTKFQSFEGFKYSSAVITNWNADVMIYNEDILDYFVKESTEFDNWNEMVKAAVTERFQKEV